MRRRVERREDEVRRRRGGDGRTGPRLAEEDGRWGSLQKTDGASRPCVRMKTSELVVPSLLKDEALVA